MLKDILHRRSTWVMLLSLYTVPLPLLLIPTSISKKEWLKLTDPKVSTVNIHASSHGQHKLSAYIINFI